MSRNTDHTRGCTGKKKYRSFSYAEVIATRSAQRSEDPMHAYHCKHCNGFHVGTRMHVAPKPAPLEEIDHDAE